jgi:hypothetical protein
VSKTRTDPTCPYCKEDKPPATGHSIYCADCTKIPKGFRYHRMTETEDSNRRTNLRKWYGITLEDYNQMRAEQDYRCVICGRHEDDLPLANRPGRPRKDGKKTRQAQVLYVDHDHATGAIRGLLCARCNTALGQFGESPELLGRAIRYLEAQGRQFSVPGKEQE